MGVIRERNSNHLRDPTSNDDAVDEDPLSDFIESADEYRVALEILDAETAASRRTRKKSRKAALGKSVRDVEGLGCFASIGRRGQRKQRRLQNEKQLRAMCTSDDDDELGEISIYDFVEDSVSAFALMLRERDNIALWNAMLVAEPEYVDSQHKDQRREHPAAFTPEQCYRRLDSEMKRTLRRHRCPMDMLRAFEVKLESFFGASPEDVYRARIDNSFARLMLHATCEYMDLRSKSIDYMGTRWTLVKNPHKVFTRPPMPLSAYLESRRRGGHQHHDATTTTTTHEERVSKTTP